MHLHNAGKAAYLNALPAEKAVAPLDSVPAYRPPAPPDPPHEPILTLPGALTAYVGLVAFIHLRTLLPPEAEAHRAAGEYRVVKRAIIGEAFGEGEAVGEGAQQEAA